MEKSKEKISFLKRVKMAIFNFENYEYFIEENFSIAMKYFSKLVAILAIVISIVVTYYTASRTENLRQYCINELPEFNYENEKLNVKGKVDLPIEKYGIALIIDTDENLEDETIKQYKDKLISEQSGYLLLSNKVIVNSAGNIQELTYEQFKEVNKIEGDINREILIEQMKNINLPSIVVVLLLSNVLLYFGLIYIIAIFAIAVTAFLGEFVSIISKVNLNIKDAFKMAIYSTTLTFILNIVYVIVNAIFNYTIGYFNIMGMMVSYVYIVAAILLLKNNLIKRQQEVAKVAEEQEKIRKELEQEDLENQELNSDEKNKEKDKENNKDGKENKDSGQDDIGCEPDGSEI